MKRSPPRRRRIRRRRRRPSRPTLRFTPTAWAKLLYLRDLGETEVGGFGIAADDDRLLVGDVRLVRQECSWASVAFDDEAVAEHFDEQVDAGRRPDQFARIWVHTHTGTSAQPSRVDETTFSRAFDGCDWAVMFILAQEGEVYARLRFNVGPGLQQELAVEVTYEQAFAGCDLAAWEAEYQANVRQDPGQFTAADERELLVQESPAETRLQEMNEAAAWDFDLLDWQGVLV